MCRALAYTTSCRSAGELVAPPAPPGCARSPNTFRAGWGYRPRQHVSPGSSLRPAAPHIRLRQRGHSHGRALRTVADRLLSVACTLLEQQTVFDPTYKVREAAGA